MSFQRKVNPDGSPKKHFTPQQAKLKIASFCAYQERCQQEVRDKLYTYGLSGEEVEDILSYMIEEGFLNEERFARAFVGGKFRIKKWGRNKILQELKLRQISPNCIKSGMKEINAEEYWETLQGLVEKKWDNLSDRDDFIRVQKVFRYLMSRGYEADIIQEAIEEVRR